MKQGEVKAIELSGQALGVATDGERVSAATVVLAAGAWSARLLAPLGYRIPFAAERGYHAHFKLRPGARLNRPIFDVGGGYAAAPIDSEVRILTGIEIAQPDDPPDKRQLEAVVNAARTILPLGERIAGSDWKGSRPSTADGLPVIGRAALDKRLLLAFGHGHIGFSTGPITGRIIADLIADRVPPIPIDAFSVERFKCRV